MGWEEEKEELPAGQAHCELSRGSPCPGTPAPLGPSPDLARCLLLGSLEERGLLAWNQVQEESEETTKALEVYGLPWGIGTRFCTSSCAQYLPFWPREGAVGVSQLSLWPWDSSGERAPSATDTRM